MSKIYKLAEAAAITGINLETLKTDSKRGYLPTELIQEGKKTIKVITAETLANLLQKRDSGGYAELKAQWRQEMFAGTHSGTSTPVSANYMIQLERGLKKLWAANGGGESIEALNANALRRTFAQYQFDEEARRDHYATKMHVYKETTRRIQRKKPMSNHREIVDYCLVCGLPLHVTREFLKHEICSSCGCHFGLDDFDLESARERRQEWLESGPKWWWNDWGKGPPENWNPQEQMKNIPPEWL